jgi:hypothetical protein
VAAFGPLSVGGFAAGGVSAGRQPVAAHDAGRALDVSVRPVTVAHRRQGWAMASYAVAHADQLHVDHVIFDGRVWSRSRSSSGWRAYDPGNRPGDRAVLEHRDHVQVDVLAGG